MLAEMCKVNISVPNPTAHFSRLQENISSAHENDLLTDLVLVSQEGVVLRVHQCLVLPLSPWLTCLVREGSCCGEPTLVLGEVPGQTLRALVQLLYTGSCCLSQGVMEKEVISALDSLGLRVPRENLYMSRENSKVRRPAAQSSKNEAQKEVDNMVPKGRSLRPRRKTMLPGHQVPLDFQSWLRIRSLRESTGGKVCSPKHQEEERGAEGESERLYFPQDLECPDLEKDSVSSMVDSLSGAIEVEVHVKEVARTSGRSKTVSVLRRRNTRNTRHTTLYDKKGSPTPPPTCHRKTYSRRSLSAPQIHKDCKVCNKTLNVKSMARHLRDVHKWAISDTINPSRSGPVRSSTIAVRKPRYREGEEDKSAKKKKRDPTMPKQAPNSFFLFCQEERRRAKEVPELRGQVIAVWELAHRWSLISPEEKVRFESQAEEGRDMYLREKEKYRRRGGGSQ